MITLQRCGEIDAPVSLLAAVTGEPEGVGGSGTTAARYAACAVVCKKQPELRGRVHGKPQDLHMWCPFFGVDVARCNGLERGWLHMRCISSYSSLNGEMVINACNHVRGCSIIAMHALSFSKNELMRPSPKLFRTATTSAIFLCLSPRLCWPVHSLLFCMS